MSKLTNIDPEWLRAMQRAHKHGWKAVLLGVDDRGWKLYHTPSATSGFHLVMEDDKGKIRSCTHNGTTEPCKAQEFGRVCDHKGAVAARLLRERFGNHAYYETMAAVEEAA